MRILSNGYGVKKNVKDICPDDYKQDPADPMICIPVFECDYQTTHLVSENCCIPYNQLHCTHFKKDIAIVDCINCTSRCCGGNKLHSDPEQPSDILPSEKS